MIATILLSSLLTLVEMNCENLFDCLHDSLKQDTEFTPEGGRHWTSRRYHHKLNSIGQAILSSAEELPDLVALCEVENDSVIHHLCRVSLLRNAHYDYLITHSADPRGLDVALLYQPAVVRPICYDTLSIAPPPRLSPSRDILYVQGQLHGGDTLHVFVVHAPSHYSGTLETAPYRMRVSEVLTTRLQTLLRQSPKARIIVTGDFNDTADSPSLLRLCEEGRMNCASRNVKGLHGSPAGYRYHGRWQQIDHVFLSPALAQCLQTIYVNDAPFLTEPDTRYGGLKPRRTYNGFRYQYNGVSDHLPLVVRLDM